MTHPDLLDDLTQALHATRLQATPLDDTLRVQHGVGRLKKDVTLDLLPLQRYLDAHPEERRPALAGFASGVAGLLKEPLDPRAAEWTFVDAASRLVPSIEHVAFELGYAAAGGAPPWLLPFAGNLRVAYYLELDRGLKVLTTPQLEAWQVTRDRVTCAARSLLYHKTGWDTLTPLPDDRADAYRLGDGYDAARALILTDLDYTRMRQGALFAIPHPDLLLLRDPAQSPDDLAAFRDAVARHYDDARYPLSCQIFTWRDARELDVLPTH
jgi:uncharacterized protein YtpQ (UPF0354 family)